MLEDVAKRLFGCYFSARDFSEVVKTLAEIFGDEIREFEASGHTFYDTSDIGVSAEQGFIVPGVGDNNRIFGNVGNLRFFKDNLFEKADMVSLSLR